MPLARRTTHLDADSRGIDFLNTWTAKGGDALDQLADGGKLIDWVALSGFIDEARASEMRQLGSESERDEVAAQARQFREWFRGFVCAHGGNALDVQALDDLGPLNELLKRDDARMLIAPNLQSNGTGVFQRITERRWERPSSLLQPIAEAIAALVCNADFARITCCEAPNCSQVFLDTTKGATRRWCSMAICGNRAKQAAHRERTQSQGAQD
jgi:predicted RNA-binding Zn ribbon-like protein